MGRRRVQVVSAPWRAHWSNSMTCPIVPVVWSKQIVRAASSVSNGCAVSKRINASSKSPENQ